jgi:3-(3-hydroxy-phenyl)propionate hydroxylase
VSSSGDDRVVDVAIVGCGPVGATLGNLLGGMGLTVEIIERELDVYHLPRAAHFDGEIMRVFQAVGLATAIEPCTAPIDGMDFVNADGTRLFGFVSPPGTGPSGWANDYMFYQPDLERALRDGLERFPDVTLRLGLEVCGLVEHDDLVELTASEKSSGCETRILARYVVGTDGARSVTRTAMGSALDDYGFDQPWLVVDTFLRRPVDLPNIAIQYCDPARPATFVPHGGTHRRWEIMVMPDDDVAEIETPERVAELLAPWVDAADYDLVRAVVYTFHALVATTWRAGRLLLAGDSAHQMPPFLGQGMCAGIRDAANLAWKLARVLRGESTARLLDSYQSERQPHVRTIIETAVAAGSIIQTTDPELARLRDRQLASDPSAAPPAPGLPALGPGVHLDGGGHQIPQIGRSDDRLTPGFTLVTPSPTLAAGLRAPSDGPVVVAPELADWFRENDAECALVRPDRYVAFTARRDRVDTLTAALAGHLV